MKRNNALNCLHNLFIKIWQEEALLPADFKEAVLVVPIYKNKGDMADCANYRIALLCTASIFSKILHDRLKRILNSTLSEKQCVSFCKIIVS